MLPILNSRNKVNKWCIFISRKNDPPGLGSDQGCCWWWKQVATHLKTTKKAFWEKHWKKFMCF